jgi:hypothetical protein
MADGSAVDWVNDPERAEALYDIDREVTGAIYAPSRVLQHLNSVAELLGDRNGFAQAQGINARRRVNARRARRLVLEQPVVYYADVDSELVGQLRSASLAEDIERLTGLDLERRAEGVALINAGQRFTDVAFPSAGTVAQAALLLCARIAGYLQHRRSSMEPLPAATAAERLADAVRRIDSALPDRSRVADLLAGQAWPPAGDVPERRPEGEIPEQRPGVGAPEPESGRPVTGSAGYPFLSDVWLRTELRKLVEEFGAGMAEKQAADPGRLLTEALARLASAGLVARVDGGVLVLPLLGRYRSVTAQIKNPPAL